MYDPPRCCDTVLETVDSGRLVCNECGKVGPAEYVTDVGDYKVVKHENTDTVKSMPRARFPGKLRRERTNANFDSVLDQFFGHVEQEHPAGYTEVCKQVKQVVDMQDTEAYAKVKKWLKQKRKGQFYPFIFEMLYASGGARPTQAMQARDRIRIEFISMEWYHHRTRTERTSLPYAWMLLDAILKILRCGSYYTLPVVSNKKAYTKVMEFIERWQGEVVNKRHGPDPVSVHELTEVWIV